MRERGRDERVIETEKVRKRQRVIEIWEWLREWGEGFKVISIDFCFRVKCMLQTMPYRGGGKRWNDVVLRLKQGNRLNRSRFTEPNDRTAVWTGPCFFRMERFFTLNGLWKWTVQGFPGWTIRFDLGSTTLAVGSVWSHHFSLFLCLFILIGC